ncbi:hypothetical protein C2W62_18535 [Candidatus Entotheonella serta]|nr:hypothetical protein C2W62_18535 [Candidatus Entotheonella serta]
MRTLRVQNLSGANLRSVNLSGADLWGADLSRADLSWANLDNIRYDADTRWPDGFTPPSLARSATPPTVHRTAPAPCAPTENPTAHRSPAAPPCAAPAPHPPTPPLCSAPRTASVARLVRDDRTPRRNPPDSVARRGASTAAGYPDTSSGIVWSIQSLKAISFTTPVIRIHSGIPASSNAQFALSHQISRSPSGIAS